MRIEAVKGSITDQTVDAVVNAANSTLLGGGGVDGAIHRAGGPAILTACQQIRRTTWPDGLPVGEAVATEAGRLPARWVIHTVGPVHDVTVDRSALLASAHTRSLAVADELGARSIAFPAISTGAYRWPKQDAARIAAMAVGGSASKVDLVRFVLINEHDLSVFKHALRIGD